MYGVAVEGTREIRNSIEEDKDFHESTQYEDGTIYIGDILMHGVDDESPRAIKVPTGDSKKNFETNIINICKKHDIIITSEDFEIYAGNVGY